MIQNYFVDEDVESSLQKVYHAVLDTDHDLDHVQTFSQDHHGAVDATTKDVAHLDHLVFELDGVHDDEVENESHSKTRSISGVMDPWCPLSLYSPHPTSTGLISLM